MRTTLIRSHICQLGIAALAACCVLTGCGGSSGDTPSASVASASPAAASTDQASTDACSPSSAVVAAGKKFREITDLSLIGGCGQVSAATTLAPGPLGSPSASRAIVICEALSKVAYTGSVYSVSVDGKDGHELATSMKDQRHCV